MAAYQYQLLPELAATEYDALKADIAVNGVLVPVVRDAKTGDLIDGHHRVRAWEELREAGVLLPQYAVAVMKFDDDEDRREHALKLNLQRRHMSREQLRELAIDLRGRGGRWTLEHVADVLGVSHETVRTWAPDSTFKNLKVEEARSIGKDGKSRPLTYAKRVVIATNEYEVASASRLIDRDGPANMLGGTTSVAKLEEKERRVRESLFAPEMPHVVRNSGENEWYTPPEYIEAVRLVLGDIDLDPASSEVANRTVQARQIYTAADNGLSKQWRGRVFMNPPYAHPLIQQFTDKLVACLNAEAVTQAIVLTNNGTETGWFQNLTPFARAICFPRGRIKFHDHTGMPANTPLQGQVLTYLTPTPGDTRADIFAQVFARFGAVFVMAA